MTTPVVRVLPVPDAPLELFVVRPDSVDVVSVETKQQLVHYPLRVPWNPTPWGVAAVSWTRSPALAYVSEQHNVVVYQLRPEYVKSATYAIAAVQDGWRTRRLKPPLSMAATGPDSLMTMSEYVDSRAINHLRPRVRTMLQAFGYAWPREYKLVAGTATVLVAWSPERLMVARNTNNVHSDEWDLHLRPAYDGPTTPVVVAYGSYVVAVARSGVLVCVSTSDDRATEIALDRSVPVDEVHPVVADGRLYVYTRGSIAAVRCAGLFDRPGRFGFSAAVWTWLPLPCRQRLAAFLGGLAAQRRRQEVSLPPELIQYVCELVGRDAGGWLS